MAVCPPVHLPFSLAPEKQYSMGKQELIATVAQWHPVPKPQNPTWENSQELLPKSIHMPLQETNEQQEPNRFL